MPNSWFRIKGVEEKQWFAKYCPTVRVMGYVSAKVSGSPKGNIGGKDHLAIMCCLSSADTNEYQKEWYLFSVLLQTSTDMFKDIITAKLEYHILRKYILLKMLLSNGQNPDRSYIFRYILLLFDYILVAVVFRHNVRPTTAWQLHVHVKTPPVSMYLSLSPHTVPLPHIFILCNLIISI